MNEFEQFYYKMAVEWRRRYHAAVANGVAAEQKQCVKEFDAYNAKLMQKLNLNQPNNDME